MGRNNRQMKEYLQRKKYINIRKVIRKTKEDIYHLKPGLA